MYHGRIVHTYLQSTMRILLERNYFTFASDYQSLVNVQPHLTYCRSLIRFNSPFSDNCILTTLLALSLKKCADFQSQPNRPTLLCKAMCLANIAKFFLLPIVIWKSQQSEFAVQLNFMIVMAYFLFSLIHVYSGKFRSGFSFQWELIVCFSLFFPFGYSDIRFQSNSFRIFRHLVAHYQSHNV